MPGLQQGTLTEVMLRRKLLDCAQDQQHEIGRNLEALVMPGEGNATETRPLTDDDEYDPEQGAIEF